MMSTQSTTMSQVTQTVFKAIDDINQLLPAGKRLEKASHTQLTGDKGKLDSLGLVNLIVAIEQKIEEDFNVSLTLADEATMPIKQNPFQTVETLANHIHLLLKRNDG